MEEMEFGNFWIKSGIPTLLAQQLKKSGMDLGEVFNAQCFIEDLAGLDFETLRPIAFLPVGYLICHSCTPAFQHDGIGSYGFRNASQLVKI